MIPFHTGMRVTGSEFCGRSKELDDLRQYMKSAGRVYLIGERRIGKTSLIFEALRVIKGYNAIYIDLMAVKTVSDVVQQIASALVKAEKRQSKVMTLLKELAHLQPHLTIDPITNAPFVGFSPGSGNKPETLAGVFSLLETSEKTIVVFDEFQDILKIPSENSLLARLRGLVQHQELNSFVFCGSIRHSMEEIFSQADSPFFNMAMRLYLGPLDRSDFRSFLKKKFATGGRKLEKGLLDTIIELCGDNPGAVQRFCTALWQATDRDQTITAADLKDAWQKLFSMQSEQYGMIMQGLSAQQAQTLKALADSGGNSNLGQDLIVLTGIPLQTSVHKALQGLISKRIVQKEGTVYRIGDPFLTIWLRSQFS